MSVDLKSEIIRLRADGVGPAEISRRLQCSKGTVSGVLFRAGLTSQDSLPRAKPRPPKAERPAGAPRRARGPYGSKYDRAEIQRLYLEGVPYKEIMARTGVTAGYLPAVVKDLPRRYPPRPRIDEHERAHVVVQRLAGVRMRDIARTLPGRDAAWVHGCFYNTASHHPETLERYRPEATALKAELDAAAADRAERAARREAEILARIAAQKQARDDHNAPLWSRLTQRNATIARTAIEEGLTLQETGDRFQITRERVRQIIVAAARFHGIDAGPRFVGQSLPPAHSRVQAGRSPGRPKGSRNRPKPDQCAGSVLLEARP